MGDSFGRWDPPGRGRGHGEREREREHARLVSCKSEHIIDRVEAYERGSDGWGKGQASLKLTCEEMRLQAKKENREQEIWWAG